MLVSLEGCVPLIGIMVVFFCLVCSHSFGSLVLAPRVLFTGDCALASFKALTAGS